MRTLRAAPPHRKQHASEHPYPRQTIPGLESDRRRSPADPPALVTAKIDKRLVKAPLMGHPQKCLQGNNHNNVRLRSRRLHRSGGSTIQALSSRPPSETSTTRVAHGGRQRKGYMTPRGRYAGLQQPNACSRVDIGSNGNLHASNSETPARHRTAAILETLWSSVFLAASIASWPLRWQYLTGTDCKQAGPAGSCHECSPP